MSDPILEAFNKRERELEEELARVRAGRAALLGIDTSTRNRVKIYSPREGSKRQQVEKCVTTYLKEKKHRCNSTELYSVIIYNGIHMGGRTPVKALASMLSTSPHFNHVKGEGYGLVEWDRRK